MQILTPVSASNIIIMLYWQVIIVISQCRDVSEGSGVPKRMDAQFHAFVSHLVSVNYMRCIQSSPHLKSYSELYASASYISTLAIGLVAMQKVRDLIHIFIKILLVN